MQNKEQIIIDGVDVAGCKYFNRFRSICHNKNLCCDCEKNQNCYYKQLARKTQECEIWKNQVLILDEESVKVQVTQEQFEEYQSLKQECEELKFRIQEYEKYGGIIDEGREWAALANCYRKALKEIKEICKCNFHTPTLEEAELAEAILNTINEIKE